MNEHEPFIGTEALAFDRLTPYELRRHYRAIMPNVYLGRRVEPTLGQRTKAAWLWSGRQGVVAGLAAAAFHGAKWVDDGVPIELIWRNARAPEGVITRDELLLASESRRVSDLWVTTPVRTAFDVGRRGTIDEAVAALDSLAAATRLVADDVTSLARKHPGARGLSQLRNALGLMDAGAQSPRETWLRLLLIRDGFPRPRTQIPLMSSDGRRRYYLDMGWEDRRLAVEYDGDQHRSDATQFAYDIRRLADVDQRDWRLIRVAARSQRRDVLSRVRQAWDAGPTLR